MFVCISDLPDNVGSFARYCIDHYSLRDLVEIIHSDARKQYCDQFGITEEQLEDAVYVAITKIRKKREDEAVRQ
jgi:hypothetical protein